MHERERMNEGKRLSELEGKEGKRKEWRKERKIGIKEEKKRIPCYNNFFISFEKKILLEAIVSFHYFFFFKHFFYSFSHSGTKQTQITNNGIHNNNK